MATPQDKLSGSDFEDILVQRHEEYRADRIASVGRYGVQGVKKGAEVILLQSLPDFEGDVSEVLYWAGLHLIFDAKVVSGPSMDLTRHRRETQGSKSRQLRHMLDRASFGARCFFLIHWNYRKLKTREEPAITYRFPVEPEHPFWEAFARGEHSSLRRADCENYAEMVPWRAASQRSRPRPDYLEAFG